MNVSQNRGLPTEHGAPSKQWEHIRCFTGTTVEK